MEFSREILDEHGQECGSVNIKMVMKSVERVAYEETLRAGGNESFAHNKINQAVI